MELIELKNKICESFTGTTDELNHVLTLVSQDRSVFPFNEYEHLILSLIALGGLTYNQYLEIRTEYISENPYLWIFEISAPTTFGKFAQTYAQGKSPALKIPSKKIDANFSNEYDLWLDGIKIEVKASRAVNAESTDPLYVKALSRNTKQPFLMNFQQLKPQCCNVFIWVAVFRDEIVVWVMSASEVLGNPLFSKGQHRGNSGNEGQLHITHDNIHTLNQYELKDANIEQTIREAAKRNVHK
ncbi:MAG: hypothetical protein HOP21_09115 [Methylotenera sp.]|nr:hypothetical protein [Methylotenera sp.]